MKRLIERIVCIALVVSFVLPNVAIPKVKAANVFSPIGTVTILVEKDPFPSGAFSSDVPEIEEQLEKEAVSDIPTNASKWTKLRYYDHLPWGEIHKRVQDDIWMTNSSPIQVGELYVPYDVNTTNKKYKYLNKKTAGEKGTYGYADIYATDSDINYLWEVKPESYRWLNKSKGEKQLQKYVDVGIPQAPVIALELGPKNMIKPTDVKKHEFDFGLTLLGANAIEVWEERVNYHVKYEVMNNSLIIYEFKRTSQKNTLAPGLAPLYAGKKALDTFLDKLKKYQDGEGTDLEPAGESAFSYESEYATEQAWKIVKDGAIATGGVAVTGAVLYSIPKLKELLNILKANFAVHNPNTGKNTISGPIAAAATVVIAMIEPITASAASDDEYVAIDASSDFHQSLEEVLLYLYPESPYAIEEYLYKEDESSQCIDNIKDESSNYEKASKANPPRDPLIIHYSDTEEIEFSTLDDGVNFDLDNNGFAEKTAWIVNDDGFLVFDVNGNGSVDNGGELFGDQFVKQDGNIALTGFEALTSLDTNKNGKLDIEDAVNDDSVFNHLYVWFDTERNGKTDEGELISISDLGVFYIDLSYTPDNKDNLQDTGTRREDSSYVYFNDEEPRKISEFWFPVNSSDTTHDGIVTSGNVPSIEQAVAEDDTLYLLQLCILFSRETDIAKKHSYLKQILYYITDSTDIKIDSRGGNIDARDLHVIEQFMGRSFDGVDGANPNINAANILKDTYSRIEEHYYNYLNLKLSFKVFVLK